MVRPSLDSADSILESEFRGHTYDVPCLEGRNSTEVRLKSSVFLPAVLLCSAFLSAAEAQVTTQQPFLRV